MSLGDRPATQPPTFRAPSVRKSSVTLSKSTVVRGGVQQPSKGGRTARYHVFPPPPIVLLPSARARASAATTTTTQEGEMSSRLGVPAQHQGLSTALRGGSLPRPGSPSRMFPQQPLPVSRPSKTSHNGPPHPAARAGPSGPTADPQQLPSPAHTSASASRSSSLEVVEVTQPYKPIRPLPSFKRHHQQVAPQPRAAECVRIFSSPGPQAEQEEPTLNLEAHSGPSSPPAPTHGVPLSPLANAKPATSSVQALRSPSVQVVEDHEIGDEEVRPVLPLPSFKRTHMARASKGKERERGVDGAPMLAATSALLTGVNLSGAACPAPLKLPDDPAAFLAALSDPQHAVHRASTKPLPAFVPYQAPLIAPTSCSVQPNAAARLVSSDEDSDSSPPRERRRTSSVSSVETIIIVEKRLPAFKRYHAREAESTARSRPTHPSSGNDYEDDDRSPPAAASTTDDNRPRRAGTRYGVDALSSRDRALADLKAQRARTAAGRAPTPPRPPLPLVIDPAQQFANHLPPDVLRLLLADLQADEPPANLTARLIPGLRALLGFFRPALAKLRAWDAGWEAVAVSSRVERAKARFLGGLLGGGNDVDVGRLKGLYGEEIEGWEWDQTLCLWHVHTLILTAPPDLSLTLKLIHRYTHLSLADLISGDPGATARVKRMQRIKTIALGWYVVAVAGREEYRWQRGDYLHMLRTHGLTLLRPPRGATHLPYLLPPPPWEQVRTALRAWCTEAVAVWGELREIEALQARLAGFAA